MKRGPKAPAPSPTDRAGWRRAVQQEPLAQFRMEDIVAAVQAMLRDNDQTLLSALVNYVSETLMRNLSKRVSKNHRNEGRDIIERAHDTIIDAMLRPDSADGRALTKTFGSCVRFRLADAIRHEQLNAQREPSYDLDVAGNPIEPADDSSWLEIEANAEVEKVLSVVADERKRLAFRLFMDRVPYDAQRGPSISKALGISEKTARDWVGEVQAQLKEWMEAHHDRARQSR
jgi:DNA-directed RNA polymerase specialized sigma24 family protein